MIRGLYTSASAMLAMLRRMEVLTNDLANVQTTGYKQARTTAEAFGEQRLSRRGGSGPVDELGPLALQTVAAGPNLDLAQGPIQQTGRSLDLALAGPGFFAVETPGGVRYTRDGSFARDADGRLVTAAGGLVLGEDGPIQLPDGEVAIGPDGAVAVGGELVGRLRLVEFGPDVALERQGNNELAPRDGAEPRPASATTVQQGAIEASNVDLTAALTATLELQRAYEASQRMIQQQDEMTARAVNEIARPVS